MKQVFIDLEARGLFFDRYSKEEIVQLFDKLNLIDKKVIAVMHSMLNQFYNYLSDKLINYLQAENLRGGERFYLQFDNHEQVQAFYDTLKEQDLSHAFYYQHKQGTPYETIAIKVSEEMKVVVATTSANVTPDFLVTLRNEVGEQKDVWEKTALLSICHETLDSIKGGSSDLQKEGMPFNVKSILKTLKEEIETSSLNKEEKEVLSFYLRKN